MQVVARRCSKKSFPINYTKHKVHRKIPVLESLSKTTQGLQVVKPATLLKRIPRTGILERAVRKYSLHDVLLNNSQNIQKITCIGVSF